MCGTSASRRCVYACRVSSSRSLSAGVSNSITFDYCMSLACRSCQLTVACTAVGSYVHSTVHCLRKLASSSITGVGLSVCVAKQSACLQYVTFKFKLVRKYFMVFFKYFVSFFVHYFACLDCLLCYRYRFVIVNALTRTAVHTNKHHPPKRSNR